jgi:tubulin epsilon
LLKSELGELFDDRQMISDVSGAGNNWAHGHCFYGPKYESMLIDKIRK